MSDSRRCSSFGARPKKDENGKWIFAVRRDCLGADCKTSFRTKDPTQVYCRNCRRKKAANETDDNY